MRISCSFLGVIFMLSTIVLVTDCCSSRILLAKDRPLRIFRQQEDVLSTTASPLTAIQNDPPLKSEDPELDLMRSNHTEATMETVVNTNLSSETLNITEKSLLDPGSTNTPIPVNEHDFITDPSVRAQQAGNPQYHVIDLYYTIMRDVLSFECTGQFLTDFCLNKGRCFRYPIGNQSFFSCECADGYVGERCESKSLNELFIPTTSSLGHNSPTHKILTARVVFSFPMLIAISSVYIFIAGMIVFKRPRKDRAGMLMN